MEKLEDFFKLKERGTSVKIEVLAGITTVSYTHLDVYKRQAVDNLKHFVDGAPQNVVNK